MVFMKMVAPVDYLLPQALAQHVRLRLHLMVATSQTAKHCQFQHILQTKLKGTSTHLQNTLQTRLSLAAPSVRILS